MKDLSASWVLENPVNGNPDKQKGLQVYHMIFVKLFLVIHGPIIEIKIPMPIHGCQIHNSKSIEIKGMN